MKSSIEIMRYLAKTYFNNECYVTKEKFRDKGFVIHHIMEIENDVLRSQFPSGVKGREAYLNALKPLVEANSSRFALIKNGIHTKLDHKRNGVTRLKMENRKRFCELALKTIHIKKRKVNKKR